MKILIFETSSCPKCVAVSNFLQEMNVEFEMIDAEHQPQSAESWNVPSVPTTILLDQGNREKDRSIGVQPHELMRIVHLFQEGVEPACSKTLSKS